MALYQYNFPAATTSWPTGWTYNGAQGGTGATCTMGSAGAGLGIYMTTNGESGFQWANAQMGTVSDFEVLMTVKMGSYDNLDIKFGASHYFTVYNSAGSWVAGVCDSTSNVVGNYFLPSPTAYLCVRFRVSGGTVSGAYWNEGSAEPAMVDMFTGVTGSGPVTVNAYIYSSTTARRVYIKNLDFATGGDTALPYGTGAGGTVHAGQASITISPTVTGAVTGGSTPSVPVLKNITASSSVYGSGQLAINATLPNIYYCTNLMSFRVPQSLLTAQGMQNGDTVSGLQIRITELNVVTASQVDVWVSNTTQDASFYGTWGSVYSASTLVVNRKPVTLALGWFNLDFDTPITYTGTDLLITLGRYSDVYGNSNGNMGVSAVAAPGPIGQYYSDTFGSYPFNANSVQAVTDNLPALNLWVKAAAPAGTVHAGAGSVAVATPTVSGTAYKQQPGAGTLTVTTPTVSGNVYKQQPAGASITLSTTAVTATGKYTAGGAAALVVATPTVSATASGGSTQQASGSMTITPAIASLPVKLTAGGAGTMTIAPTTSGTVYKTQPGAGSLSVAPTVSGTAYQTVVVSGSVALSILLYANSGTNTVHQAQASLSIAPAVSGTAIKLNPGAGSVSLTQAITGTAKETMGGAAALAVAVPSVSGTLRGIQWAAASVATTSTSSGTIGMLAGTLRGSVSPTVILSASAQAVKRVSASLAVTRPLAAGLAGLVIYAGVSLTVSTPTVSAAVKRYALADTILSIKVTAVTGTGRLTRRAAGSVAIASSASMANKVTTKALMGAMATSPTIDEDPTKDQTVGLDAGITTKKLTTFKDVAIDRQFTEIVNSYNRSFKALNDLVIRAQKAADKANEKVEKIQEDLPGIDLSASLVAANAYMWDTYSGVVSQGQYNWDKYATVVATGQAIWDRANAITTDGKFDTSKLNGTVAKAQLGPDVQTIFTQVDTDKNNIISLQASYNGLNTTVGNLEDTVDTHTTRLTTVETTANTNTTTVSTMQTNLNSSNKTLWYSSIKQTSDYIDSVVAKLTDADSAQWYSSIKQTWDSITSVVTKLNTTDKSQMYSSIKQTADSIDSTVAKLNGSATATDQFSSIKQTATSVNTLVGVMQGGTVPVDYTWVTQTNDAIINRVVKGSVISEINQSAEQVTIAANKINLTAGDIASKLNAGSSTIDFGKISATSAQIKTAIGLAPDGVRISGNNIQLTGNTSVDGTFKLNGANLNDYIITTQHLAANAVTDVGTYSYSFGTPSSTNSSTFQTVLNSSYTINLYGDVGTKILVTARILAGPGFAPNMYNADCTATMEVRWQVANFEGGTGTSDTIQIPYTCRVPYLNGEYNGFYQRPMTLVMIPGMLTRTTSGVMMSTFTLQFRLASSSNALSPGAFTTGPRYDIYIYKR